MANPNPKLPPIDKRFKKGNKANPLGGNAHNPAVRAMKTLTLEVLREVIEVALTGTLADLKALAENPSTPAVQVGVATAIMKSIKSGDPTVLERFCERLVGKIPDKIEINSVNNSNVNQQVTVIDQVALKTAMIKLQGDV
jgi:hypothetical protein